VEKYPSISREDIKTIEALDNFDFRGQLRKMAQSYEQEEFDVETLAEESREKGQSGSWADLRSLFLAEFGR
jgi:hypothetical protein